MIAIKQIKTDGTEVDLHRKRIDFKELQALVSTGTKRGIFEFTRIKGHPNKYKVGGQCMAVHEEGLLVNLPINEKASELANNYIVGDVVIIENEQSDFS